MRGLTLGVTCLLITAVFSAPAFHDSSSESADIEQELVRHHHSTAADDNKAIVQSEEDNQSESSEEQYDDSDIYDITVGDVIRDVLLTLRDHPEIVKELIESEKAKLAEKIAAANGYDSVADELSGFQQPAQQLQNTPKQVEKKAVGSGMPVVPGSFIQSPRSDGGGHDSSDVSDESFEYQKFLKHPHEGGESDSRFNYEQFKTDSSESSDSDSQSESSESDESRPDGMKNRLPFINPLPIFEKFKSSHESSESSVESESRDTDTSSESSSSQATKQASEDTDDSTDDTSESSDTNENELKWLLHKMRASA